MTRSCPSGVAMKVLLVILLIPATICLPQVFQPRSNFGLFSREDFKYYQNSGDGIGLGRTNPSSVTAEAGASIRSTLNVPSSSVFSTNQQQQLRSESSPSSFSETPTESTMPSTSTLYATATATASVSNESSTVQSNVSYLSTNATETVNVSDTSVVGNATEKEKVVMAPFARGEQSKISSFSQIFQHTLVWLNDTYVLSILIPVCFGFVIASVVIVAVATCRCIRRRYLRRRLRSKVLPESIKNMRRSDRTRLLAESSDEEF